MKRLLLLTLCLSFSACGPGVNQNVQVTIDKNLLEGIKPSASPSTSSSPSPGSSASPSASVNSLDSTEVKRIEQTILENADALNAQDVNAFYNTLHPSSEFASYMPDVFYALLQFRTRYNIRGQQVKSISGDKATVSVERRTSDTTGTLDQDILYTMRQHNGAWKVFFMTDQSEILNDIESDESEL